MDDKTEAIESMIRIGADLRRGDQAIADLADLQRAIEVICPQFVSQITGHAAKLRRGRAQRPITLPVPHATEGAPDAH